MKKYSDIDSDSGVDRFEINESSIIVRFKGSKKPYTYSYQSAGQQHVEQMKRLAMAGDGLNAYIQNHVKTKFVR